MQKMISQKYHILRFQEDFETYSKTLWQKKYNFSQLIQTKALIFFSWGQFQNSWNIGIFHGELYLITPYFRREINDMHMRRNKLLKVLAKLNEWI